MNKPFLTLAAFLVLAPGAAQAQGAKVLTASASVGPKAVTRGTRGVVTIAVSIAPQFHINEAHPSDPSLIPTTLTLKGPAGVTFGPALFPLPHTVKVSYSPKPLHVYVGKTTISVPFTVSPKAKPGRMTITGTLGYQGCNAASCFPPASLPVKAAVVVKITSSK